MARFNQHGLPILKRRPTDHWGQLKELSMFFDENDPVHKAMRKVAQQLEKAGIPYAVVGGMAVFAHKYRRATNDVDILLTKEGFAQFRDQFVGKKYQPVPDWPKRFLDPTSEVTIDFLITGLFPGSGLPGPIAYPNPKESSKLIKNVRYVDLVTLIQLKLAAGRHRDLGDVVELIRFNNLDESFPERLHSSLRNDYIECLEEKRRDDVYRKRQGQAMEQLMREKRYPKDGE